MNALIVYNLGESRVSVIAKTIVKWPNKSATDRDLIKV